MLFSKPRSCQHLPGMPKRSLHSGRDRHILASGKIFQAVPVGEDKQKSRWLWPFGLIATGLAGATVVLFRGCWHGKMSWPVRAQGCSYQVCLGCGIKRLFDEQVFRAYGPYSYDLNRLIAWDEAQHGPARPEVIPSEQRPAS